MEGGGGDPIRSVSRLVLGGFVATVVAFAVAMTLTLSFGGGIHGATEELVRNGTPSVMELSEARTELRHLEVLLDDTVERAPAARGADEAAAIGRTWRRVTAAWRGYLLLPASSSELALQPEVEDGVAAVEASLERALSAGGEDARATLLAAAKSRIDRLDDGFIRLERYNRNEDVRIASRIERIWRRSLVIGIVAVLVVVALGLATATAVMRLVRHVTRALHERAEELDAFAGRIAHDLVSPLTATIMTLTVARGSLPLDEQGRSLIDRATAAVRRAAVLVHDLYRYATAAGLPEPGARTDVAEAVRGVVEQQQAIAAGQRSELALGELPPSVVACPHGVVVSILGNLVDNALKHRGERQPHRVAVCARDERDHVRVEVEDSGPGIAPAELGRVFQPYVRGATHAGGLGLGLATVKRLTERYGGRVGVRSAPGVGSTFWFELPKADAAPGPASR